MAVELTKNVCGVLVSLAEAAQVSGGLVSGKWLDMTLEEFIITVMAPNNIYFVHQPPLVEPVRETKEMKLYGGYPFLPGDSDGCGI